VFSHNTEISVVCVCSVVKDFFIRIAEKMLHKRREGRLGSGQTSRRSVRVRL